MTTLKNCTVKDLIDALSAYPEESNVICTSLIQESGGVLIGVSNLVRIVTNNDNPSLKPNQINIVGIGEENV